jgi:hypothetical protein
MGSLILLTGFQQVVGNGVAIPAGRPRHYDDLVFEIHDMLRTRNY